MIHLSAYEFFEILVGLSFLWVAAYLLSKNPTNILSWIVFFFLSSVGFVMTTDPILLESRSVQEYIRWQKITDWPLFFSPILYYHASILCIKSKQKFNKYLIPAGYLLATLFYIMDIHGGLILRESVLRLSDYKRFDGFAAGVFLIPSVSVACLFALLGAINFFKQAGKNLPKYFLPAMGGIVYFLTGVLTIIGYNFLVSWADIGFMIGLSGGAILVLFSLIRYHLFSPTEKVFDKNFVYKTIGMVLIILLYSLGFSFSGLLISFEALVLLIVVFMLVIFTHSFYDWLSTFINDFLYNPIAGFSIVNDQEVYQILKNYNSPDRLEGNSLLRLNILKDTKYKEKSLLPVDVLRSIVKDSIEYFKPEQEPYRRTKQNLKYHLLKMLVFDGVEEGQMLWELGFDEYPVKIMSHETKERPPLFARFYPSDYTYTSRNAFLALKKEALHDVTWRISYIEKLAKKKLF